MHMCCVPFTKLQTSENEIVIIVLEKCVYFIYSNFICTKSDAKNCILLFTYLHSHYCLLIFSGVELWQPTQAIQFNSKAP
jgi:hypothetical protein